MRTKLFFCDTETTGLNPYKSEINQLAALIDINGKVVDKVDLSMKPDRPLHIHPKALAIQGRTQEEVMAYPDRKIGFATLKNMMGKHVDPYDKKDKFIMVGHNVEFDKKFVQALFYDVHDAFFGSWFDYRIVCTVSLGMALTVCGKIKTKDLKLGTLCDYFKIKLKAHDAMADIVATREVFYKMVGLMS